MYNLTPYPIYKDSGIDWLGEVPQGWGIVPNRILFQEINDINHSEKQLLSVTITKGIIKQKDLLENSSKRDSSNEDKTKYKLVQPGDIAYNKMRAWQGSIGLSFYEGIVSPAYIIQRPRNKLNSKYFHYLFRTPNFAKEAERWSYGITSDQWSLRPEHFKMIYSCLPPIGEQDAIVKYLDYVDGKIQKYINIKQRLIRLLNEEKQAMIYEAVTGKIDVGTGRPHHKYKRSGITWIEEIPEDWEIKPGFIVFKEKLDKNKDLIEKTVLSLSYGRIIIKPEEKLRGLVPESFETYQIVRPGDIIIRATDLQNDTKSLRTGYVKDVGIITSAYLCLYVMQGYNSQYVQLLLHSYDLIKIFYGLGTGMRQNLSFQDFKRLPIIVPPIKQQETILKYVQIQLSAIDKEIDRARGGIDLLQEYWGRLIADVVTGKVDVQNTAKGLPDGSEIIHEIDNVVEIEGLTEEEVESVEEDSPIEYNPV